MNPFSVVTQEILDLSEICMKNSRIDPSLYGKYDVKRGLRDISGRGVLTGLTEISSIQYCIMEDDEMIPC